jgi:hypothetical protein
MIKRLSIDQIDGLNLIPVASIAAPTGRFRELGYEFHRDADDLDQYEFAAFEMEGRGVFALMHYDHAIDPITSLLFDERIEGEDAFLSMMAAMAEAFGLPGSLFHWRWNGQRVSLAEPAAHGRDQAA